MSWKERIANIQFKIVTGDGAEYTPLWKNPQRSKDFNASVFEFNEVQGSLVRRGKASSFKFPIELHFTGDDHIQDADAFMESANDQRSWTLTHPNYAEILVQPINLNQSDAFQNDSVITGELFETIPDTFPDSIISVQSKVLEQIDIAQELIANDFAAIGVPEPTLISTITSTINNIADKFKAAAQTAEDLLAVQNAVNDVINSINNLAEGPVSFMNSVADLARTPAKFYASVQDRIRVIEESFDDLKQAVGGLLTRQNKIYFEATGGALTIAKAEASVILSDEIADDQGIEENDIIDYRTRSQVISTADSLTLSLSDYYDTLGTYQSEVNADPDSYTPQPNGINAIKESINFASGQLLQIAVDTKQERKYILQKDTNLIVLVHRLLGNTENSTIENFVEANQILLEELVQVPKGREVIYYI